MNTSVKMYVAKKPCKKSELLIQFNKRDEFINVTKEAGIIYFEDEIGYYYISGEITCDTNGL